MGALPKRRISKSRQGKRRAHHSIDAPQLVACPNCGTMRLSHRVCPNCGTYRGHQVLVIKERPPRTEA